MDEIYHRYVGHVNKNTFEIKPIQKLVCRYLSELEERTTMPATLVDPFTGNAIDLYRQYDIVTITNDINPAYKTTYNLDAEEFLEQIKSLRVDLVIYDPPYSQRHARDAFVLAGVPHKARFIQSRYWSRCKNLIATIVKPGGIVISCDWNSSGMGEKRGFTFIEGMLVCFTTRCNDIIVKVERKEKRQIPEIHI